MRTISIGALVMKIHQAIGNRLVNIGRLPLCNQNAGHAPRIGRLCMPLCWRCTSIVFGMLIGMLVRSPLVLPKGYQFIAVLLCIPCFIDVAAQRWFDVESTTARRVATGLLTGVAISLL